MLEKYVSFLESVSSSVQIYAKNAAGIYVSPNIKIDVNRTMMFLVKIMTISAATAIDPRLRVTFFLPIMSPNLTRNMLPKKNPASISDPKTPI